ncbi:MAG: DUF1501 domain-containing protein [Gemmataceae bacterium]|nr:DUF1501 domain-containing protein [Gemmataceae bacterium]
MMPNRRDCLKLGLGGLLGGSFVNGLRLKVHASDRAIAPKADACILVWLDGGPTHYETFDPKPDAPAEIRGEFKPIATRTSGMHFSEHMSKLAAMSDKLAIIRSMRHDQGNHGAGNHYLMTGAPPRIPVGCGAFVSYHPSMGSVVAHELPAPNGLPAYFSMPEMSRSGGPNFLGARFAPFVVQDNPNTPGFRVRDVALPAGLSEGRFGSRQEIRREVDRMQRLLDPASGDPAASLDENYRQGYDLISSVQAQAAFDIHRESERVRDRYGRSPFGQRALLARRLVEAGVPWVTLYHGGWDHHTNLFSSLRNLLPSVDQVVATLIDDLHQRGMLERTMVIVLGEFGRTPQINKDAGRDHWSNSMSVLFAGGGTPGGICVGATDVRGYSPVGRTHSPENFVSSIYLKLGIDPNKILYSGEGRPSHIVSDPTPIQELMA